MSTHRKAIATALGLAAVLFVAVNALAGPLLRSARFDLTEQKLYTLSAGTKALLGKLEEPIHVRLYFSKSLAVDNPQLLEYAQRVEEMLQGYAAAGGGEFTYEVIDPEPFSEDEDRALGFGIQGTPISIAGERFYFGLVGTNQTDGEKAIPVLDPSQEAQLEYDLSELVDELADPSRPVIGLITSLPLSGGSRPDPRGGAPQETPPWAILEVLQSRFDVRTLDGATLTEIPSDVTTLLLIHPKGLPPEAHYAIDQWCLAGGKVVAFVDPFAEFDPGRHGASPAAAFDAQLASELDELLKAWGVELRADVVVGDRELALNVQDNKGRPIVFPPFIELGEEQASESDMVSRSLTKIRMLLPGALQVREDKPEGATVETLLETTATGGTISSMRFLPTPDPVAISESFASGAAKIPLAVRISGTVRSAFPDGPPKDPASASADGESDAEEPDGAEGTEGTEETGEAAASEPDGADGADDAGGAAADGHLAESSAPFNAIVIADADMLYDGIWAQNSRDLFGNPRLVPIANNAALLVGALENMTGTSELISLRSRAEYRRPFVRKDELAEAAQARFREKERELEEQLKTIEREYQELQKQKDPSQAMFLSPEQEKKVAEFREKQVELRKELRGVKRDLRREIDELGAWLKFFNILFVPVLILVFVGVRFFARLRSGPAARRSNP